MKNLVLVILIGAQSDLFVTSATVEEQETHFDTARFAVSELAYRRDIHPASFMAEFDRYLIVKNDTVIYDANFPE